jgi:hypothetical protein
MGNHVNDFANVYQGYHRRVGRSPGPQNCPKQCSGLARLIKDDVSVPTIANNGYGTDIDPLC